MVIIAQKNAAGVGKADRYIRECNCSFAHHRKLSGIGGVVRFVGAGEVAHDEGDVDTIKQLRL
ncbi:hypothetical protein D3C73_1641620 [compost metagenome]